jgi:hypothetical protein
MELERLGTGLRPTGSPFDEVKYYAEDTYHVRKKEPV